MVDPLTLDFPLPSYDQSLDLCVPSYSEAPATGEQRLLCMARAGQRDVPPPGKSERSARDFTVVLDGQPSCSAGHNPTYGMNSIISGNITLAKPQTIAEVTVKLLGKMETVICESGAESLTLIKESYTLWNDREPGCSSSGNAPESLPFSIPFPSEFDEAGSPKTMPPSLDVTILSPPLFGKVTYQLVIHVIHVPKFGGLWQRSNKLHIWLTYRPKSRPYRPIQSNPDFLATLKSASDEWFQEIREIDVESPVRPPVLNVFIPSAKIFALSDTIPLHLQLSGHPSILSEFLPPSYTDTHSSSPKHPQSSQKRLGRKLCDVTEPKLRVFLLRQFVVEIRGIRTFRNIASGEAELTPLPHSVDSSGDIHLDWMGWLKPDQSMVYGGFNIGHMAVKDFIMVEMYPSNKSSFKTVKIPISVRMVTEPWIDGANRADHHQLERARTSHDG